MAPLRCGVEGGVGGLDHRAEVGGAAAVVGGEGVEGGAAGLGGGGAELGRWVPWGAGADVTGEDEKAVAWGERAGEGLGEGLFELDGHRVGGGGVIDDHDEVDAFVAGLAGVGVGRVASIRMTVWLSRLPPNPTELVPLYKRWSILPTCLQEVKDQGLPAWSACDSQLHLLSLPGLGSGRLAAMAHACVHAHLQPQSANH